MPFLSTAAEKALPFIRALQGLDTPIPVPATLDRAAAHVSAFLQNPAIPQLPHIDYTDVHLSRALIATALPPLLWNVLGQLEYRTRALSRLARRPIIAVYACAALIAALSVYRSALFVAALQSQPRLDALDAPAYHALAGVVGVVGVALFLGAYYRLGVVGTYLGDYFGMLMGERITTFPFSVVRNPMYDGSSLVHLAEALLYVLRFFQGFGLRAFY